LQQVVQLPFLLQRMQVVGPAHVLVADEDLRNRAPPGAFRQPLPGLVVARHVDLLV